MHGDEKSGLGFPVDDASVGQYYFSLSRRGSPLLEGSETFDLEEGAVKGKEWGVHVEMSGDGNGEAGIREPLD